MRFCIERSFALTVMRQICVISAFCNHMTLEFRQYFVTEGRQNERQPEPIHAAHRPDAIGQARLHRGIRGPDKKPRTRADDQNSVLFRLYEFPPQNRSAAGICYKLKQPKAPDLKRFSGIEKCHRNSIKITVDLWRRVRDSNPCGVAA